MADAGDAGKKDAEDSSAGETLIPIRRPLSTAETRVSTPGEAPAAEGPAAAPPAGGKYEVEATLGRGGMGEVLLVRDRDLGREVAMKVMRGGIADLAEHRQRFIAEAQATSQLEHPGIPPVHEIGVTPGGSPYFTMKVVRGGTLREVLDGLAAGRPGVEREYTLHRLATVLERISEALHFAHEKGVIHRDLKPENVMLGSFGEVHVMDWGIAKLAGSAEPIPLPGGRVATVGDSDGTRMGTLKGTLPYMSPEQASGRADEIDRRTDVYALGCILYEVLTLSPAFAGTMQEVLPRVHAGDFPPVATRNPRRPVPEGLAGLCARAMARDRESRPATAREFAAGLRSWLDGSSEAERRHREAEDLAARGREAAARYEGIREEIASAERTAQAEAARFKPWQSVGEKAGALDAAERVRRLRGEGVQAFAEATRLLYAALEAEGSHPGARAALCDLWKGRLEDAERTGDLEEAAFARSQVARHDDGRLEALLAGHGTLDLRSDPPGAEVSIRCFEDRRRMAVPGEEVALGRTPVGPVSLPMGSYLCLVRREGFPEVRYPVHLTRNFRWEGLLRLRTAEEVGEGFVLVPAGPFLRGEGVETRTVVLPDFSIARRPVTMGEYAEFLAALDAEEGPAAAARRLPGTPGDGPMMERAADGTYRPLPLLVEGADRERCRRLHGEGFEARLPVVGVSFDDAEAYGAWRTRAAGREWRLPTEDEREKAARGVDGRRFPWGALDDPSLARCQDARDGRPHPEPVGSFPAAASVYGMEDACGNAWDWTQSWTDDRRLLRVLCGGSWGNPLEHLRCANRRRNPPDARAAIIGFRCARSLA